ncbi:PREDICTED: opioid growth factor receptor-like [Mandrillus leucophaeus]|uniref:opioid growth factor receptor-like n=1 Tax=Mandrillus leucophaeus TaxID=9568 RepID=UPI0005F4F72B|nr:PREDICTED: opioid growth factor receptor-like [Mandrillus leucophaeus]
MTSQQPGEPVQPDQHALGGLLPFHVEQLSRTRDTFPVQFTEGSPESQRLNPVVSEYLLGKAFYGQNGNPESTTRSSRCQECLPGYMEFPPTTIEDITEDCPKGKQTKLQRGPVILDSQIADPGRWAAGGSGHVTLGVPGPEVGRHPRLDGLRPSGHACGGYECKSPRDAPEPPTSRPQLDSNGPSARNTVGSQPADVPAHIPGSPGSPHGTPRGEPWPPPRAGSCSSSRERSRHLVGPRRRDREGRCRTRRTIDALPRQPSTGSAALARRVSQAISCLGTESALEKAEGPTLVTQQQWQDFHPSNLTWNPWINQLTILPLEANPETKGAVYTETGLLWVELCPFKKNVETLTLSTSECDLMWEQGYCKCR